MAQQPAKAATVNTTAIGFEGRGWSTTTDDFFRLRKTRTHTQCFGCHCAMQLVNVAFPRRAPWLTLSCLHPFDLSQNLTRSFTRCQFLSATTEE
jgi:hypothetical protein